MVSNTLQNVSSTLDMGKDKVSAEENSKNLSQDFIRLKQGDFFLEKFYERAEETDTEVSRGLFIISSVVMAPHTLV